MTSVSYRPEVDGLRAVAVVAVVLFHLGFAWIPGGFVGVDVFFVISGFLITSIILKEHATGTFTFRNFWLRRIRRILPVLLSMVLITSIVSGLLVLGPDRHLFGLQGLSAMLSFANISMWQLTGNYWGPQAENSPFLHTWSLSVEEQFYLLFPASLILLLRLNRAWVFPAFVAVAGGSFAMFLYGSHYYPAATFYLLPTRAWELAIGCALSEWSRNGSAQPATRAGLSSALALAGLVAVVGSNCFISGEGGLSAALGIPVIGTALVIAFGHGDRGFVKKVLAAPPMVYIGKISYSLYMWHWPVLVFTRYVANVDGPDHRLTAGVQCAVILALAVVSYHFIEVQTRHRTKVLTPVGLLFLGSLSSSLLLCFSNTKFDTSVYRQVTWLGWHYDVLPTQELTPALAAKMEGIWMWPRDPSEADAYTRGGIVKRYGEETPGIMLLGDSHAGMWASVIDDIARELKVTVSFDAMDGVTPFFHIPINQAQRSSLISPEEKVRFDTSRLEAIKAWKPLVVLVARWAYVGIDETRDTIEFIGSQGAQVLLIEQPPELVFGRQNTARYLASNSFAPKGSERQFVMTENRARYESGRELVRQLSREYRHCHLVETADIFSREDGLAWVLDGAEVLYIDGDHLSTAGAQKARKRIAATMRELLGLPGRLDGE